MATRALAPDTAGMARGEAADVARLAGSAQHLVGRSKDLGSLIATTRTARLVTVTGLPGVGKTAVATAAASSLRGAYPDGVWPVALGELRDDALVAHTVADALAMPGLPGTSPIESLAARLRERRLLLMLDTCEHVAPGCGQLAAGLLASCPGVRVLATSTMALLLPGERVQRIRPLTLGHAVVLFGQRAREAAPDFRVSAQNRAAVAAACRRLDRLPLAIELAARRLQTVSLDQLRSDLAAGFGLLRDGADTPGRHTSLQAAIDWSYRLCAPAERLLWARLSVFGQPFRMADAIAVCADGDLPASTTATALRGLADRSLLPAEDGEGARYRLPETIRAYGATMLARLGEEADMRRRYRNWRDG